MVGAEEDRHKGQPDDAGGVHREPDVLCLVEVLCRTKEAFVKEIMQRREIKSSLIFFIFWQKIPSVKPPLTLGYEGEKKNTMFVNGMIWVSPTPLPPTANEYHYRLYRENRKIEKKLKDKVREGGSHCGCLS
jgi:hypothetical protein